MLCMSVRFTWPQLLFRVTRASSVSVVDGVAAGGEAALARYCHYLVHRRLQWSARHKWHAWSWYMQHLYHMRAKAGILRRCILQACTMAAQRLCTALCSSLDIFTQKENGGVRAHARQQEKKVRTSC